MRKLPRYRTNLSIGCVCQTQQAVKDTTLNPHAPSWRLGSEEGGPSLASPASQHLDRRSVRTYDRGGATHCDCAFRSSSCFSSHGPAPCGRSFHPSPGSFFALRLPARAPLSNLDGPGRLRFRRAQSPRSPPPSLRPVLLYRVLAGSPRVAPAPRRLGASPPAAPPACGEARAARRVQEKGNDYRQWETTLPQ